VRGSVIAKGKKTVATLNNRSTLDGRDGDHSIASRSSKCCKLGERAKKAEIDVRNSWIREQKCGIGSENMVGEEGRGDQSIY